MDSMGSAASNEIMPACSLVFHGHHNFCDYHLTCVFETRSSPLPRNESVEQKAYVNP